MHRQQELPLNRPDCDEEGDPTVTTERVTYNVQNETWFRWAWRPVMAWVYAAICLFDFIIAPTAVAWLITFHHSTLPPWTALTLQSGGMIHIAFGTILGVAAWGRTREKQVEMGGGYGYQPPYPQGGYPYPQQPVRTVMTETTIVGNNQNRPLPPRPQRRE